MSSDRITIEQVIELLNKGKWAPPFDGFIFNLNNFLAAPSAQDPYLMMYTAKEGLSPPYYGLYYNKNNKVWTFSEINPSILENVATNGKLQITILNVGKDKTPGLAFTYYLANEAYNPKNTGQQGAYAQFCYTLVPEDDVQLRDSIIQKNSKTLEGEIRELKRDINTRKNLGLEQNNLVQTCYNRAIDNQKNLSNLQQPKTITKGEKYQNLLDDLIKSAQKKGNRARIEHFQELKEAKITPELYEYVKKEHLLMRHGVERTPVTQPTKATPIVEAPTKPPLRDLNLSAADTFHIKCLMQGSEPIRGSPEQIEKWKNIVATYSSLEIAEEMCRLFPDTTVEEHLKDIVIPKAPSLSKNATTVDLIIARGLLDYTPDIANEEIAKLPKDKQAVIQSIVDEFRAKKTGKQELSKLIAERSASQKPKPPTAVNKPAPAFQEAKVTPQNYQKCIQELLNTQLTDPDLIKQMQTMKQHPTAENIAKINILYQFSKKNLSQAPGLKLYSGFAMFDGQNLKFVANQTKVLVKDISNLSTYILYTKGQHISNLPSNADNITRAFTILGTLSQSLAKGVNNIDDYTQQQCDTLEKITNEYRKATGYQGFDLAGTMIYGYSTVARNVSSGAKSVIIPISNVIGYVSSIPGRIDRYLYNNISRHQLWSKEANLFFDAISNKLRSRGSMADIAVAWMKVQGHDPELSKRAGTAMQDYHQHLNSRFKPQEPRDPKDAIPLDSSSFSKPKQTFLQHLIAQSEEEKSKPEIVKVLLLDDNPLNNSLFEFFDTTLTKPNNELCYLGKFIEMPHARGTLAFQKAPPDINTKRE